MALFYEFCQISIKSHIKLDLSGNFSRFALSLRSTFHLILKSFQSVGISTHDEKHSKICQFAAVPFATLVMGCNMFSVRLFEDKNRVFEFDYQKTNMFKSVRCSMK